jgi:putative GTP pyrophosphokinase
VNLHKIIDIESWYFKKLPIYNLFENRIWELIDRLLKGEGISVVSLHSRTKEFEKFRKKFFNKPYSDPEEIVDIVGIRIIGYVKSDNVIVCGVIRDNFHILGERDKSEDSGYKSKHFVATLTDDYTKLPIYSQFKHMKFEIQVCTILEHAWAELEHDIVYKNMGIRSESTIQQTFKRLSEELKSIDDQFEQLSRQLGNYSEDMVDRIINNESSRPLNPYSLRRYLTIKFGDTPEIKAEFGSTLAEEIIEEMRSMGIETVEALDKIIPMNLKQVCVDKSSLSHGHATFTELIRIILIIYNIEAYFTKAFKWNSLAVDSHFLEILETGRLLLTDFHYTYYKEMLEVSCRARFKES